VRLNTTTEASCVFLRSKLVAKWMQYFVNPRVHSVPVAAHTHIIAQVLHFMLPYLFVNIVCSSVFYFREQKAKERKNQRSCTAAQGKLRKFDVAQINLHLTELMKS
jgi:hypothetical protein